MQDDLISRQAAIDAFLTELTKRERKNLLHTWSTVEVKYFITKMLEQMPSAQPEYTEQDVRDSFNSGYACGMEAAQPEIVRCKNCAWWQRDWSADGKSCCYCPMVDTNTGADFYCANAERRT